MSSGAIRTPQWSPVMKTGNTPTAAGESVYQATASMEPGHEDREYMMTRRRRTIVTAASMEPGHEDREYGMVVMVRLVVMGPQWSPVMKTGNTGYTLGDTPTDRRASMEPGHEDREYRVDHHQGGPPRAASMEPGHEDREYSGTGRPLRRGSGCLNGARS